jgi:hypothetical protein
LLPVLIESGHHTTVQVYKPPRLFQSAVLPDDPHLISSVQE